MNKSSTLFEQLNKEQQMSCNHLDGPALTLAIPGSGKTTLLLARTYLLMHKHQVDPKRILTVTFSKAAANDMLTRYNEKFPDTTTPSFSTIHALSYRILKTYEAKTGKSYQLIENDKKNNVLRQLYKETNHQFLTDDGLDELHQAISLVENLMLAPKDYPDTIENLTSILQGYRDYKHNYGLIDFDDMLKYAYQLLRKYPKLLAFYQNRFDYIQMDEAQDTSLLQHRIIALLAKGHQNLFYVADDDQSIYGFRGAYPEMLLDFNKRFPTGRIYYLSMNYRSTPNILNVAQHYIEHNEHRYEKQLKAFSDDAHSPHYHFFDTLIDRNNYMMKALNDKEDETVILYRNHISAIPIVHRLHQEGIAFNVQSGAEKAFDHPVIQDIKAFMQLAMCPQDLDAFTRIAFKTNGYISKKHLQYLQSNHMGKNIFDTLTKMPKLANFQQKTLLELGKKFDMVRHQDPKTAMWYIDIELGYLEYAKKHYKEAGRKRLELLRQIANDFDNLLDFIEYIDQLKNICATEHYASGVKLMTMHASKGLEFDRVFIIDIDDSAFSDDSETIEEDRRLLYVAMTRAKHQLEILSYRFQDGQLQTKVDRLKELEPLFL